MLNPGQVLRDRYEVENFLARGVLTRVYRARDLAVGRQVLLKELTPPVPEGVCHEPFLDAFSREAELLGRLEYRCIPRLLDSFTRGGMPYQVVELLPGRSLADMLSGGKRLPVRRALDLGREILEILSYVHRLVPRVLHRDLQPAHFVVNRNNLYLVNFSHAFEEGTVPGRFHGLPGYAPPEQLPGGEGATAASDVYSAAVIIHQMLSGINPLALEPGQTMPSLIDAGLDLPRELSDLLMSAMSADPRERPGEGVDFLSRFSAARSVTLETRRCSRCGNLEASGAIFCSNCGLPDPRFVPKKSRTDLPMPDFPEDPWKQVRKGSPGDLAILPDCLVASRFLGFENLVTIDHNKIDEFPHQVSAVRRALRDMGGRCILADEVGLGKTIEAGIILEELRARGLVRSVLVVVPSHLRFQWRDEMAEKFDRKFAVYANPRSTDLEGVNELIISFSAVGRRGKTRDRILARRWDMVIVDEAHHARNSRTLRWKFLEALRKNYMLLLSATPVQNKLSDLFNLVTLLRPGHLSDISSFRKQFVDPNNPRKPVNVDRMKELVSRVMIRTRRADALIRFPRRHASTRQVELSHRERELYDEVTGYIGQLARDGDTRLPFGLMQLQQRLTSSPMAAMMTLEKFSQNEKLFDRDQRNRWYEYYLLSKDTGEPAKTSELVRIIENAGDRVVVFTGHVPTREYLARHLNELSIPAVEYRGNAARKQEALEYFRREGRVLLATQAGGEGLNLQDASNIMVNYDLPWNPMQLEQRIGRLQRLGQTRDVFVFNLAGAGTIESYVLEVLQEKIKMFQLAVGQLDLILGARFTEGRSFEEMIWNKLHGEGDGSVRDRVLSVGDELAPGLEEFRQVSENDRILDQITESYETAQQEEEQWSEYSAQP